MLLSLSHLPIMHLSSVIYIYLSTYLFCSKAHSKVKKYRQYEPDLRDKWGLCGHLSSCHRPLTVPQTLHVHLNYFSRHHCNLGKLIQLPKGALPYEDVAGTLPWVTGASAQATASWLLTLFFSSRQPWPSTSVCWAGALLSGHVLLDVTERSVRWAPAFQPISSLLACSWATHLS